MRSFKVSESIISPINNINNIIPRLLNISRENIVTLFRLPLIFTYFFLIITNYSVSLRHERLMVFPIELKNIHREKKNKKEKKKKRDLKRTFVIFPAIKQITIRVNECIRVSSCWFVTHSTLLEIHNYYS